MSTNRSRRVEVVPYDPNWPLQFTQEAEAIKQCFGENCIEIYHIGSTSVPGLAAKPVIDMIPVVLDITKVDAVNHLMQKLGYEAQGEFGMPFRRYFQKGGSNRTHHAHVYELGNSEIDRHVKFRDWMRTHPEDRESYAKLKQDLAKQFPNDTMAYCLGKEQFITGIDKKTGFIGLRIVKALSPREWEAVRHFRQYYFFDKVSLSDPYTWTFDHEAHVHFVLYMGTDIIGYAHIQLWPEARAALRIIVIDENHRNHAYGQKLLLTCERWLKTQGYKCLHIESSPQALGFYRQNNYLDMPFNDPDGYEGHPQDTAVGKVLV